MHSRCNIDIFHRIREAAIHWWNGNFDRIVGCWDVVGRKRNGTRLQVHRIPKAKENSSAAFLIYESQWTTYNMVGKYTRLNSGSTPFRLSWWALCSRCSSSTFHLDNDYASSCSIISTCLPMDFRVNQCIEYDILKYSLESSSKLKIEYVCLEAEIISNHGSLHYV